MSEPKIRLVWKKIDELIPYEHNAKLHPQEQLDKLVNSYAEFGRIVPAGIDGKGRLIYGHGRILAARQRGDTDFPCIEIDGLSDNQRRAFVHADNLLSQSGTDESVLRAEMIELSAAGFDISLTGYDPEGLVIGDDDDETPEIREDDFDEETPEEPVAQRGQIWQLGEHRLMCGDATSAADVQACVGGGQIPLAFTDPPYGIKIVSGRSIDGAKPATFKGRIGGSVVCSVNEYSPVIGDENTEAAQKSFDVLQNVTRNQIVFGANYFADFLPPSPCWLVWDKRTGANNFADVELAWTSFSTHARLYSWLWAGMARQGDKKSEGRTRVHPTQKPVGLIAAILRDYSQTGDVVLDPFGGSGSTLIACEQLGRRCRMMEIDPHYCDVIIRRWETFTGEKAVLLNG